MQGAPLICSQGMFCAGCGPDIAWRVASREGTFYI